MINLNVLREGTRGVSGITMWNGPQMWVDIPSH